MTLLHNKMSIIIFKYVYQMLSLLYTSITDPSKFAESAQNYVLCDDYVNFPEIMGDNSGIISN